MLHAAFVARMSQYDATEIAFIEEVSKDERTLGRHYGRSSRGKRAHVHQPFVRGCRVSLEALLTLDGIVACIAVEGSTTKKFFLEWLEF
jgi:hypothetical protein